MNRRQAITKACLLLRRQGKEESLARFLLMYILDESPQLFSNSLSEEMSKENRGTEITLHLKDGEEYSEFLEEWKIKELVKKYSNYIRYEIYFKDEVINSTKPIWKRDKKELKDEDYNEFYKATFHDWNDPLFHINLKVQGNIEYNALLFIPKKLPFD